MGYFPTKDWEFNTLNIYNYKKHGKLASVFDWMLGEGRGVEGDILEAGCFRGKTLLAFGLFVLEHGLNRKVYGYDTFSGFPAVYHENDDFGMFDSLASSGRLTPEHFSMIKQNEKIKSAMRRSVEANSISTSGDFSNVDLEELKMKIEFLGLTEIVHLVKGDFSETMSPGAAFGPDRVAVASLDCDLYSSYMTALPFVWASAAPGSLVYLDEYFSLKFPGARIATDEFSETRGVKPKLLKREDDGFERWALRKPAE